MEDQKTRCLTTWRRPNNPVEPNVRTGCLLAYPRAVLRSISSPSRAEADDAFASLGRRANAVLNTAEFPLQKP